MRLKHWTVTVFGAGFALGLGLVPAGAGAQARVHAQAGTQEEIEMGATHPSKVEMSAGHERRRQARVEASSSDGVDDGLRVGLQARLEGINSLRFAAPDVEGLDVGTAGVHLLVPLVAPGVRLLDARLFLGLGLGLAGGSSDNGMTNTSRSGFSLTPMAHYDLLEDGPVALSVGGWLNFARLGETESCNAADVCTTANDDVTGWGLSLAGGVHAWLTRGLRLGGEFGWGFLSLSDDRGTDSFVHGLFGAIVLEATIGI